MSKYEARYVSEWVMSGWVLWSNNCGNNIQNPRSNNLQCLTIVLQDVKELPLSIFRHNAELVASLEGVEHEDDVLMIKSA